MTAAVQARGPLGGVLAAMITPLNERGNLDDAGLHRIINHLMRNRVHGISPSGIHRRGSAPSSRGSS